MMQPERRDPSDERGMVAIMVLLLGVSLLMVSVVVVSRAMTHARATLSDARWEQALYVAESGLNVGAQTLRDDPEFTTGETIPDSFADREAERAWVVAAADARPAEDLVATPEGEYVVVKPANGEVFYAVGYVPGRDHADRRVRVLNADIDEVMVVGPWLMEYGLLSGDDLYISGDPLLISGTSIGIHANGRLTISGTVEVQGCATTADGDYVQSGNLIQAAGCDSPSTASGLVDVPDVSPRQFWHLSEYDLCPSGAVRAGPAHPVFGNTTVDNRPCTGNTLTSDASNPYMGWKYGGCCDSKLGAKWNLESDNPPDGVFYIYRGSVDIAKNPGTTSDPWQATVLVEGEGSCSTIVGGDVYLSGNPNMTAAPSASNLTIVAGRDLEISGNPDMVVTGIIAAYEQLKLNGNPSLREGGYIAQEACDSVDDNIQATEVSGNPVIDNSGPLETPFTALVPETGLTFWDEL